LKTQLLLEFCVKAGKSAAETIELINKAYGSAATYFSVVFFLFFACYTSEQKHGCYYRRITYWGRGEHIKLRFLSLSLSLSVSVSLYLPVLQTRRRGQGMVLLDF
jgi:hypothetical protein